MRPPIAQSIVFTYTDDLERASRFMREVLALEQVRDQGACRIFRLTRDSFIGVCDLPDRPRGTVGVTLSLITDDVAGWYAYLHDKGVTFKETPARKDAFGITTSLLETPDGYRIEIQRFDTPLGEAE